MRTICFIDSERYFAYHTSYSRGTKAASVLFLLLIWCWLASSRPICVNARSFRTIFSIISTSICNNPPAFFHNTNTGFVRIILMRYTTLNCRDIVAILLCYRTVRYGDVLQHLLIQLRHLSHTHRPGTQPDKWTSGNAAIRI